MRVIKQSDDICAQRRQRLEQMLDAELARLVRLIDAKAPARIVAFQVDTVVEDLVLSHEARGLDVRWSPSGHTALGDPDDVAEVVNILLENAARHGGGTVTIDVETVDAAVEIRCRDEGPGIAYGLRDRLFVSGERGPRSEGQGLGLTIARRLLSQLGGSLDLQESEAPGATFVARLPRNECFDVAPSNVA